MTDLSTIVNSACCNAMETRLLQIECSYTRGFAGLQLIGNTTEICRDGKERARAALEHLAIHVPPRRLVVSLTPADILKDGNHLDLPIAVSLALLITERTAAIDPERWLFAAELGLAGELRPVKGAVCFAVAALAAELDGLVVSPENLAEVATLKSLEGPDARSLKAIAFPNLKDVLAWLMDGAEPAPAGPAFVTPLAETTLQAHEHRDFDDMILDPIAERAALTAAVGMHSVLLRGCPGSGKTMLASRLPSILPPLERAEHVEALRIYSSYVDRIPMSLVEGRPPYRAPHHQASSAAVLGNAEQPGELALAHGGVLFLDEFPEFRRDLLEALREPLETGEVRVSRSRHKSVWKARVMLVAACNNCPCGWHGSSRRVCDCPMSRLLAYRLRLSGPLLDRIDLHVNMPERKEDSATLLVGLSQRSGIGESTTERLRKLVIEARRRAATRNAVHGVIFNRDLPSPHLVTACGLTAKTFSHFVSAAIPASASARSVGRCIRVARTLADLDGADAVEKTHFSQAWLWQAEGSAIARGDAAPGKRQG